jgi:hypothetical protein
MAYVDVAQGEPVGDIDDETRERLLTSGAIGKKGGPAFVVAARPVAGEVEPDEIDTSVIPGGSIEQVMAWVGDDLARARVAAEMERAKGPKARAGLLAKLDGVRADQETEPPAVPEYYTGDVQPAPAGGVVEPNEAAAAVGKTGDQAPAATKRPVR